MLAAVLKAAPGRGVTVAACRRYSQAVGSGALQERLRVFERLWEQRGGSEQGGRPLKVSLGGGASLEGSAGVTRPLDLVQHARAGKGRVLVARVNGQLWDLRRPLEEDCELQLLDFDTAEGREALWRSSAVLLGGVLEAQWVGQVCRGGSSDNGFFCDFHLEDRSLLGSDLSSVEQAVAQLVSQKLPFLRLQVSQAELRELFQHNQFKLELIEQEVTGPTTTVYRCGSVVDVSPGPLVSDSGRLKAMRLLQVSAVQWGSTGGRGVQRVLGVAFPDGGRLRDWEREQEEARARDHRRIGKDQELFFFSDVSPGSCFFLPKGAHIYNTLIDYMKSEYRRRGFSEVMTPTMFSSRLWRRSGHWEHYSDDMFSLREGEEAGEGKGEGEGERDVYALKPMNCPAHCVMFEQRRRSWRELPVRWADFGALHRDETSGALSGLTRLRRFTQDDAHIFCTPQQLEEEVRGCLHFLRSVYSVLGFSFRLLLSTRPDPCLGEPALWDTAERELQKSLEEFGQPWQLNPGDGAFYGPKIDIQIKDAIGRYHQCATIQLDFQLPIRFNLRYTGADGAEERPVLIHRAVLGSLERMIAILAENCGGRWPLWLSPAQVMVIPVGGDTEEYAQQVVTQFREAGFMVEADLDHSATLNRKIRNAQLGQYNFILVVGERERGSGSVSVRTRGGRQLGQHSVSSVLQRLSELRASRTAAAEDEY
ncbi:threonine--tRNA ligase 1, cytoplasmic [Amia ocellicauda]|uniref:threonine--tRNA ligase 1, cytoplasmic n=1 Tax=Amia ocellicauda TaxID=2972642 RepID=UPI0034639C99